MSKNKASKEKAKKSKKVYFLMFIIFHQSVLTLVFHKDRANAIKKEEEFGAAVDDNSLVVQHCYYLSITILIFTLNGAV